uniref:Envelope glycoprotein n=1 Tax=Pseudonaja textilis TaxID=8673 RepID=A0A670XP03_PSETE
MGEVDGYGLPYIQNILNITLYTLNFLNMTGSPAATAASRHFASSPSAGTPRPKSFGFLLTVCVLIISQRGKGVDLGEWKRNTLIQDMEKLANLHNKTDCWVCMHMPTHKTSGLPMVAVPLAEGDWYRGQCYGCSGTWSSSWTTSNINTLHLGSRIQEVAGICWTHNETVENMTYLGTYPFCNKTIVIGNGSRVYPDDMKTKNLTYFVHNISKFDITSLINENGCPYIPNNCINRISSTLSRTLKGPYDCCINQTVTKRPDIGHGAYVLCTWMWLMWSWESQASDNTYHKHLKYFPLPDGLWLLCGDTAYQQWPKDWSGVCIIGFVIPVIYKLEGLPIGMRIRNREVDSGLTVGGNLWTQISRAAIPPLGIAMNYEDIHILNNFTVAMFNDTVKNIKMLNEEVSEIRQVTLQNRYALDIMLAAKGGVCALIHSHCCVFIYNYEPNITRTVHDMEDRIAEHEAGKDGFNKSLWALLWDWLPDSSWLRLLLQLVVIIVIILIMLCCCIQCSIYFKCVPQLFSVRNQVARELYVPLAPSIGCRALGAIHL